MEKDEVDAKPGVVDAETPLAAKKREIVAQLQQEISEVTDGCFFQIGFRIFVLEVDEFEDEWVFVRLLCRDCIRGVGMSRFFEHRCLIF
jgi:hypothetical protein